MKNRSFTILLSSHKNLSHTFAHMEDSGTHIGNFCTKPKALQQKVGLIVSFFQRAATCACVSACVRFAFTCVR